MTDKKSKIDSLGAKFKADEKRARFYYDDPDDFIFLRIDGRAFHSYTKELQRPFDNGFNDAMKAATMALCQEISGVRFAYTQSDEISLVIKLRSDKEQFFMGGEQNKLVSLSASIATAAFLKHRFKDGDDRIAHFDSRIFVPFVDSTPREQNASDYFLWRHLDCTKNSVSMMAHSVFGHKALNGVSTESKKEMLRKNGTPWEDLDDKFRFGTMFYRERTLSTMTYVDKRTNLESTIDNVERFPVVEKAAHKDTFLDTLKVVLKNGEVDTLSKKE